jgi:Xaa-Pro dipeptidase
MDTTSKIPNGVQERIQKVRSLMKKKGVDGILLRKRRSFSWLTGGKTNHILNTTDLGVADLLILENTAYCITTKMEAARIKQEELTDMGFEWMTPEWYEGRDQAIADISQGRRIGSDVYPLPVGGLSDGLDLSKEIAELSYVLSLPEINRYRWLSQTAAKALEATCREIEVGMTEYEIQAQLASRVMKEGINPQVILVATDERIYKYRHPIPTDKRLESYAMIVICAEKWGLVTNATRFVHFGSLSEDLIENKRKLAVIDLHMNLATRPGVKISDIFDLGIETYGKMGHSEDWRLLHQGGPTGYASREFLATPHCAGKVQLHQAFAWNPAIRGIKSEDTILVKENENEVLTYTGEWEYIIIEQDGKSNLRPDILVR